MKNEIRVMLLCFTFLKSSDSLVYRTCVFSFAVLFFAMCVRHICRSVTIAALKIVKNKFLQINVSDCENRMCLSQMVSEKLSFKDEWSGPPWVGPGRAAHMNDFPSMWMRTSRSLVKSVTEVK